MCWCSLGRYRPRQGGDGGQSSQDGTQIKPSTAGQDSQEGAQSPNSEKGKLISTGIRKTWLTQASRPSRLSRALWTMVNGAQKNFFHEHIEDWEVVLLNTNETTDSTAHFRLATKYMGIVILSCLMPNWSSGASWMITNGLALGATATREAGVCCASLFQPPTMTELQTQKTRRPLVNHSTSTMPLTLTSIPRLVLKRAP